MKQLAQGGIAQPGHIRVSIQISNLTSSQPVCRLCTISFACLVPVHNHSQQQNGNPHGRHLKIYAPSILPLCLCEADNGSEQLGHGKQVIEGQLREHIKDSGIRQTNEQIYQGTGKPLSSECCAFTILHILLSNYPSKIDLLPFPPTS